MGCEGYEESEGLQVNLYTSDNCSGTPVTVEGPINVDVRNCVDVGGGSLFGIIPVPGKAESFMIVPQTGVTGAT